jgi:integrase
MHHLLAVARQDLTEGAPLGEGTIQVFENLTHGYIADYELHGYRSITCLKPRIRHLRSFFGGHRVADITNDAIRRYQAYRRSQGASAASVNRETTGLNRMFKIAVERGSIEVMRVYPRRLRENPPRQGFFEHREYVKVRAELPKPFRDVLDFAYFLGWRRNEILNLTWSEVDLDAGVVRLSPARSKTDAARLLPLSDPLRQVLARRRRCRRPGDDRVFHRDGVPVRAWRRALCDACIRAGVPLRLLHDCRRTAARNLVRAGVPERVAMVLTGHKTRCVFDRYNIVNERELVNAGDQLVAYLKGR